MQVLTCSSNHENLRIFAKSIYRKHIDRDIEILCVDDGASENYCGPDINFVQCNEDFSFSKYINYALEFVEGDFVVAGDDTKVNDDDLIFRLRERMQENDGLISPGISGVCSGKIGSNKNRDYKKVVHADDYDLRSCSHLPLIFTLINSEVLSSLDYFLDEDFSDGYGFEDVDLNFRLLKEGFDLSVSPSLEVSHEKGQQQSTWRNRSDWTQKYDNNREIMKEKWGEHVV